MLMQLIDPYWTLHPCADRTLLRLGVSSRSEAKALDGNHMALALMWLWSVRLTHSYFRRCSFAAMLATRPFFSTPFFSESTSSNPCKVAQPPIELTASFQCVMLCKAWLTPQLVGGLHMHGTVDRPDTCAL